MTDIICRNITRITQTNLSWMNGSPMFYCLRRVMHVYTHECDEPLTWSQAIKIVLNSGQCSTSFECRFFQNSYVRGFRLGVVSCWIMLDEKYSAFQLIICRDLTPQRNSTLCPELQVSWFSPPDGVAILPSQPYCNV